MSYSVGGAIGPLLGGLVLQRFPWGAVFLLGVPVMALLLFVGPRLLPEYRDPNAGRLDLGARPCRSRACSLVIYGVKRSAEHGFGGSRRPTFAAGSRSAPCFCAGSASSRTRSSTCASSASRASARPSSTNVLGVFVAFGAYIFISQYLQLVLGLSPLVAGLWTLPW